MADELLTGTRQSHDGSPFQPRRMRLSSQRQNKYLCSEESRIGRDKLHHGKICPQTQESPEGKESDFTLQHGNGVRVPKRVIHAGELVQQHNTFHCLQPCRHQLSSCLLGNRLHVRWLLFLASSSTYRRELKL